MTSLRRLFRYLRPLKRTPRGYGAEVLYAGWVDPGPARARQSPLGDDRAGDGYGRAEHETARTQCGPRRAAERAAKDVREEPQGRRTDRRRGQGWRGVEAARKTSRRGFDRQRA